MNKVRLPYGLSNFNHLVSDGYYFVDKTDYWNTLGHLSFSRLHFLNALVPTRSITAIDLRNDKHLQQKRSYMNTMAYHSIHRQELNLLARYGKNLPKGAPFEEFIRFFIKLFDEFFN